MQDPSKIRSQQQYHSKLDQWDSRATVRQGPRRVLEDEEAIGKVYFPVELLPVVRHPKIEALGPQAVRYIQIQRLYAYLNATTKLERHVVNPATLRIAEGDLDIEFPDKMRRDADKIYTDEAWHAQFSNDLIDQVVDATRIPCAVKCDPYFLATFRRLQTDIPEALQPLTALFYAMVNETLISALLGDIPRSVQVITAVRDSVADHAKDEAIHHRFFSDVLRVVWPSLSGQQQQIIGPLLPDFILWFLQPDLQTMSAILEPFHFSPEEIQEIFRQSYPDKEVRSGIREAAKHTIALFDSLDILSDPAIQDRFLLHGLLE